MSSSQSHLNEISRPGSDEHSGFHQPCHHLLQQHINQSQTSPVCPCSHHYHHIHHHHSTGMNPHLYHHRLNQSPHPQTQHEDNERQISGETHVAVTVHQQSHQYQALDSPAEESCDCQEQSGRSSRLVSGDEAIPSGSEDKNIRKCPHRSNKSISSDQQRHSSIQSKHGVIKRSSVDDRNYSSRIEVYSDGTDSGVKVTDGATSEEDQGPPLPPRPPPRPRTLQSNENAPHSTGVKKYVVWCLICGGFSCLLGVMFLGVYFLLRSYTSTVGYFETVPTFVPATLLILTGLCIMSLARRRNRYSYLIKLSGACGLASALTCALVTVTTTVLHMSRLQALRECEYTQKTRTCTCYSVMIESQVEGVDEEGVRFVFDSTADCGVVHGALYSCLRAVFGLSVAGVLVAVFSCMLVYQLLSHERKKMYWEQLELRCRSLYASQQGPPPPGPINGPSIIGTPRATTCRCCEQCHSHRNAMAAAYPWDGDNRFWAPGQPGNFYSPNPGGDELTNQNRNLNQTNQRSRITGWSWPRMPWQRNEPNRFRQTPSSPDSQYGFSNAPSGPDSANIPASQGGYSAIGGLPYGVWGPPPPYSDPNSPARRGRYQYVLPNSCQTILDHQISPTQQNMPNMECHQHSSSTDSHSMEPFCQQQQRSVIKRQAGFKSKDNYENTPSDSDGPRDRFSNTLPARKTKKRVEIGAKSIGPNSQPQTRVNVQNVFTPRQDHMDHEYHEPGNSSCEQNANSANQNCHQKSKKLKTGVENGAFQNIEGGCDENDVRIVEPTESEVYFADVSSCCNMSVKNDNYYDDASQRQTPQENDFGGKVGKEESEDYLAQRFGKRENSIRSRLPFPQMVPDEYEKQQMNLPLVTPRQSLIQKDISRQSMCSVESGEKTDFTDLSPATPCSNFTPQHFSSNSFSNSSNQNQDLSENQNQSFVASFPFSSNEQSQEAHRRSTKNLQDAFLAPDAQYEIIKDGNQFESTPLTLSYDQEINFNSSKPSHFHKPKSPKNLNLTPIKRQNLGTNITSIIQNLGGTDVGLLYPDSRREPDHDLQECKQQNQQQQMVVTTISSENDWTDPSDRRL